MCIFSTLTGGYLPCLEFIEDYQLKISTVRRDYHHPSGTTNFSAGTLAMVSVTTFGLGILFLK